MIHPTDLLDAILSDGGPVVVVTLAPCEECDTYHIISHGNDEKLCELCRPETKRLAELKKDEALRLGSDGVQK